MFTWWGRTVVRMRKEVLAGALMLVVVGIVWGTGVFGRLRSGGFDDPHSPSAKAAARITAELGSQTPDVLVLYTDGTASVDDPAFGAPVAANLAALASRPEVAGVRSPVGPAAIPSLVSADRHAMYAAVSLHGTDDDAKRRAYDSLLPALRVPGVRTQIGGVVAFNAAADDMTKKDVTAGEMLAMPIVLILLAILFGSLVAALMPLLVGIVAILGALTAARVISDFTDLSTFAANTITVLGLGMAVDYALFVVSRFREEMRAGRDTSAAISATIVTAGRTVAVSGITIVLALSSLLIFPQAFLRSMGFGAMAAVLIAMLAALTALPAALAVLGPRIDAFRVPRFWSREAPSEPTAGAEAVGLWARLAHSVMRRPVRYAVGVLAVLAILAVPLGSARFAGADERILPPGTEARVVGEQIAARFPATASAPIQVLVDDATAGQVQDLEERIKALPGVADARAVETTRAATLLAVDYQGPRSGRQAYAAVRAIRALPEPSGVHVLVGGRPAEDVDQLHSMGIRLPWMAAIMASVTLVLLFLAFGSVVLPVKAVVMNVISIAASFGVVVWIFGRGHLSGTLGFTATGTLEPNVLIFTLAVLFGLATDYEVFLLSRVREAYDATGDNTASVAAGLQRTGRIITAAALLLIVVLTGFAGGRIVFAQIIGVGMIVAILVDATLVRALLVPATMRLLGRWNWWAPGPLVRIHRRYGIRESQPTTRTRPTDPSLDEAVISTD